jgi:hypothetical protein
MTTIVMPGSDVPRAVACGTAVTHMASQPRSPLDAAFLTTDTAAMWRIVVFVIASAVLVGCTARDDLAGAYETQVSVEDAAELAGSDLPNSPDLTGTWRMDLIAAATRPGADEHSYDVQVWHRGDIVVRGKATASATQLTVEDESGSLSYTNINQARGRYDWTLRGQDLTLAPVDDGCGGRRLVNKHVWHKVR